MTWLYNTLESGIYTTIVKSLINLPPYMQCQVSSLYMNLEKEYSWSEK